MPNDHVRDEAERLMAAAIAAVSIAARSIPAGSSRPMATGSPECCVCPVCRVIAGMRDPSPDMAEKLATGAGDLAAAVAGVLRTLARGAGQSGPWPAPSESSPPGPPSPEPFYSAADEADSGSRDSGSPGSELTDSWAPDSWSPDQDQWSPDPWEEATATPPPMAKKAVRKVAPRPPAGSAEPLATVFPADVDRAAPPAGPTAEKAVAKKAVAKKAVAKKAVAKKAVAKKAVAQTVAPAVPAADGRSGDAPRRPARRPSSTGSD